MYALMYLVTACNREATPLNYDAILLFLSKIITDIGNVLYS
jgi:hypothetical protein